MSSGNHHPNRPKSLHRIAVDPLFPPPIPWKVGKLSHCPKNLGLQNRFELLFDSDKLDGLKFAHDNSTIEIDSDCQTDVEAEEEPGATTLVQE